MKGEKKDRLDFKLTFPARRIVPGDLSAVEFATKSVEVT